MDKSQKQEAALEAIRCWKDTEHKQAMQAQVEEHKEMSKEYAVKSGLFNNEWIIMNKKLPPAVALAISLAPLTSWRSIVRIRLGRCGAWARACKSGTRSATVRGSLLHGAWSGNVAGITVIVVR